MINTIKRELSNFHGWTELPLEEGRGPIREWLFFIVLSGEIDRSATLWLCDLRKMSLKFYVIYFLLQKMRNYSFPDSSSCKELIFLIKWFTKSFINYFRKIIDCQFHHFLTIFILFVAHIIQLLDFFPNFHDFFIIAFLCEVEYKTLQNFS